MSTGSRQQSIFGHPATLDVRGEIADWIGRHWPVPHSQRQSHPIHITEGKVSWDRTRQGFTCSVFDLKVEAHLTDNGFILRHEEALLSAVLHDETSHIAVSGAPQKLRGLLLLAVDEAVRLGGLLPFHASALARDGRCAILMGPSKTGKSTTLVSGALAGYRPLGEDMLWVDPVSLEVYSNDSEIRLWADSLERFRAQLPAAKRRLSDGKYAVPLNALPGYTEEPCMLQRLVVLKRDLSRPSAWEPVPELELVRTLWESSCVPITPRARELAQEGVAALSSKIRSARLVIGATPLDFGPLLEFSVES